MLLTEEAYLLELGFSNSSNPTSNDDFLPLINTLSGGDQIGHLCQNGAVASSSPFASQLLT